MTYGANYDKIAIKQQRCGQTSDTERSSHDYMDLGHVIIHALADSAMILPILLPICFLIEWIEYKKYTALENSRLLCGKLSPLIGALFGSIPQCGFSVAATDLFAGGSLSAGALVAVYIATSDEAIPIMLSRPDRLLDMLALILTKLTLGILAGYITMALLDRHRVHKHALPDLDLDLDPDPDHHGHGHDHEHGHEHEHGHKHEEHIHEKPHSHASIGCCKHEIEGGRFEWRHPLFHCAKIFFYVLCVNFAMGAVIELVGEDRLVDFLGQSKWLQPILASLVGLIPNCASSVVLTELYLLDGLTFGAVVSGLSVNAGLGLMVLYKENSRLKENISITALVMLFGLFAGYLLTLLAHVVA